MTLFEKLAEKNGIGIADTEKTNAQKIEELERSNAELREALEALLQGNAEALRKDEYKHIAGGEPL